MKVITWNFHKGRHRRGRSMVDEAAAALLDRCPDLLLCQEVFHTSDDAHHQSALLAAKLGLQASYGPNRWHFAGCLGNATMSRYPVLASANFEITHSYFERRGILYTRIDVGGYPLDVYNTHFSLTTRQRRKQLAVLLAILPPESHGPIVLAGDFNDWTGSLDRIIRKNRHFERALGLLPALRDRATFPARRPLVSLDRIYCRACRVLDVRVLRGAPWNRLSDHLPIEAEIIPGLG